MAYGVTTFTHIVHTQAHIGTTGWDGLNKLHPGTQIPGSKPMPRRGRAATFRHRLRNVKPHL